MTRSLLESHLRQNYGCIFQGHTLHVESFSSTGQPTFHSFLVTETKPGPACSCIDVDIDLDIVPESQELAREAVERKYLMNQNLGENSHVDVSLDISNASSSSSSSSSFSLKRPLYTLQKSQEMHFKFRFTPSMAKSLTVEVVPESGDSDLFISTNGVETPSVNNHEYYNVDEGVSSISFEVLKDPENVPFM
jgi:hypothetical protein